MTPEENQLQLEHYRSIIFATIEYEIQKEAGRLNPKEQAYSDNFNRVWKEHIEMLYNDKALEKLKKYWDTISLKYKITADLDYVHFIKEKTGCDIDLYGNIYERMDKIIARKRITNRKERNDVISFLQLCRKTSIGQENAALLQNIKNEFEFSLVKEKSPEEEMFLVKYLHEINSPDNKRYLNMYETVNGLNPSTYLNLNFESGRMISLFALNGINLNVKMYWKDNNTVIIETKKEYPIIIKQTAAQYLQNIVYVEYVES